MQQCGDIHFYVDYRKMNNVMKKHCFLLPQIDNILDTLAGAKGFFPPDLNSGYWQVDLHPDDRDTTAFLMGQELWQFTVMPFGL
jgi:hypothetical protein